jgi:phospholipid/cholesterol/gamma-HCH transport system substrate-binding protein
MDGGEIRGIISVKREIKVGLFIVCTTIIICLALLYLAREKGFFEIVYTFTLSSKSGDGFTEGMPVVFSGFDIGKVHALELNDKGIVLIKIKIPQRHVKWIRTDSTFIIYRPLIGAARIVVTTNNLNSKPMPKDKIPEVETVNDINDAIEKIQPLLEKITQIAENLERLSSKIDAMAGKTDEQVFGKEGTLPQVNRILKDVNGKLEKLNEQALGKEGTLPQVNKILRDVAGKLEKLNTTVDNINKISTETSEGMKDFRTLRSNIDDTVKALDDVAKEIDAIISKKKEPEIKVP